MTNYSTKDEIEDGTSFTVSVKPSATDLNEKRRNETTDERAAYERTNRKYVVFVCSFFIHFITDGFGAMLSVMFVDIIRAFDASRSEASLMQSLVRGLMYGGGSFADLLMRKFGYTKCTLVGCFLVVACVFASAFANDATTVVLLIGVGAGSSLTLPLLSSYVGVGLSFRSSKSFTKYMAYSVAGGGVGSIVLPYVAEVLLQEYGWRGLCMIMSGINANLIVFTIGIHYNMPKNKHNVIGKKKTLFHWSIFRNPMFVTFLVILLPYGLTGFVESWYVPDYLVTIGYTREQGSILLTVIGAANSVGRMLAGLVHPICRFTKTPIIYHWIYTFLILAASHAIFPLFTDYSVLFAASIVYGVAFGLILSQCSPVIHESVGMKRFPEAQALDNTIYGIFSSLGGVLAGSITDASGSYDMVFYLAAAGSLFCALCSVAFFIYDVVLKSTKKETVQEIEITHM